ncbi:FAD-dependent oxidoreductase [Nocardioides cavernaquae]|uniref:FAD-dependent oxidoreductase n=2 Tax=Nocardioides cavernaquae TaxID=2321396 RepID=A0A3A5HA82_9ACTN|nr:FAD-dependent oxidoreductase [Nocardioides cavernaquae]
MALPPSAPAPPGHASPMPVILAVDDDPDVIELIRSELVDRYGRAYRIEIARASSTALKLLEDLRERGDQVALVLADQWLPDGTGCEVLASARELFPHARRLLLISWGEWAVEATARPLRLGIGLGNVDYFALKPWRAADELFHRTVTEFLHEWVGSDASLSRELTVVADQDDARASDLRTLLTRNQVPYVFHDRSSPEGAAVLAEARETDTTAPVVVQRNGLVLVDPTNVDIARAYGANTALRGSRDFDVAVIGAGPSGLAAAVYASSEGLRTVVLERETIGGQAGTSSRIRNYLGFQRGISGADLAQRAQQQAWLFGTTFVQMCEAQGLRADGDRFYLASTIGPEISTRVVMLAMGVSYQRLGIPTLEALVGTSVFYGASPSEGERFTGRSVFVVGGGNSAGQAAVHLARHACRVTILVRRATLAETMSRYLIDEIEGQPNITVRYQTQIVDGTGDSRLESLTLQDSGTGKTETVPADAVFVLIGARPYTQWLPEDVQRDRYGFVVTGQANPGWVPERAPFMFESSMAGVFAVGDVRSGSVKRVASAAGEGSVAIAQVHEYLQLLES